MSKTSVALVAAVVLVAASPAVAQSGKDWWGNFALNYTEPVGTTSDKVGGDIGFTAGFAYAPEEWPVGILTELAYVDFDAPSWTVESDDGPARLDGHAQVWSLTANAVWTAPTTGRVGFYLTGGVGVYRREVKVTTPGGYDYILWCDPWWGYCWYEPVPVDLVLGKRTDTDFGLNGGVGVTFKVGYTTQLYLEARYHWADTPEATEFVPIAFGIRF